MNNEKVKEDLLTLVREKGKVFLTDLVELMPEIKGEHAMYMPIKKPYNPNIAILITINPEFSKVFYELVATQVADYKKPLQWNPEEIQELVICGAGIIAGIPLATVDDIEKGSKKECWLPSSLSVNERFSSIPTASK